MENPRLVHDCCWAATTSLTEFLDGFLPPGDRTELFHGIYERLSAAFEAYQQLSDRQAERLHPSKN